MKLLKSVENGEQMVMNDEWGQQKKFCISCGANRILQKKMNQHSEPFWGERKHSCCCKNNHNNNNIMGKIRLCEKNPSSIRK